MITNMRGCVACNDLWPWPISSRSFGLDLENRVLSVASTVLDGFFPYLVQMITSMRRCVACDDLWPWPICSRSFGLDLENCVLSVASTGLGGFFPYLVQMITSMKRCVPCDDLWPWLISSRSFDLDFENRVRSLTFSVLDRLFFWLGIQYDSIVWVIMRRRGVSPERRRSSCSSYLCLVMKYREIWAYYWHCPVICLMIEFWSSLCLSAKTSAADSCLYRLGFGQKGLIRDKYWVRSPVTLYPEFQW